MQSGIIVGYDPGGNHAHGVAELQVRNGRATGLSTRTVRTAEDVVSLIEDLPSLAALGVDTLTCWGTGVSGWRPADRWLRQRYEKVQNSVVSPNGLFGSMGLNGMAVVVAARQRFTDLFVTETHPKVLYWHLSGVRYDYQGSKAAMDAVLAQELGISVAPATQHEWDAALSAFAALESSMGRWSRDLHRMPTAGNERLIKPCGTTHFFWPE